MPAGTGAGGSGNTAGRTVFRPPWVKEGPTPIPTPTAPWTLKHRESKGQEDAPPAPKFKPKPIETKPTVDEDNPPSKFPVQLRKTSGPQPKENGRTSPTIKPIKDQVTLRPTPKDPVKIVPIKREDSNAFERPKLVSQRTLRDSNDASKPPPLRRERPKPRNAFDDDIPSSHILRKQDSILNIIPPAPPVPPAPPCPPPPPKIVPDGYKPPDNKKLKILEQLRQRPRARPDWGTLLKDVEAGRKLKHVVCNDRSKPLLPLAKCKTKEGQFVYDSEKKESNVHNILLKQIQGGVQLKKVQTNDRSKPILDGLRKFRRQMTIEEQIQKSQSSVKLGAAPDEEELIIADEVDEMDDIDKLRDDLQSTKQLLALELRNKEAQQKEIKRLQARILNLEVELEHEKGKAAASVTRSVMAERIEDDKLVSSLKQEADDARKAAKEAEKKYLQATDTLDTTKGELDEAKRQNEILERKLEQALKALSGGGSRRQSQAVGKEEGEESEEEEEDSDSDDDDEEGEETEEKKEKRAKRELKMLMNKLKNVKTKKENARKERQSLKQQMKKEQDTIKEEKKKYKHLQREVDKMAELMKEDDDENADDDGEEKEIDEDENDNESVEEEEEESETETESSSESEEEESESEPEDAPFDKRKENYTSRVRRYENCLAALKKGNYLLKANIDRLKDDINKQREMSIQLQQDLDSVLNDLG